MEGIPAEAFAAFLRDRNDDLTRIARASRGEWSVDDVRNQAYVLAVDIRAKLGRPLDLANPDDALLLIRWLYNECVKYAETVVRYATRLDHADRGDDDRDHHWLQDRLAADDGVDPLSLLETAESAALDPDDPDPYHSPAAGFAFLLQRFHRMADVAEFLLISVSWFRACYSRVHQQAKTQWPLPHELTVGADVAAIRPWRRYKLPSRPPADPRQLCFDYWHRPAQPPSGQLWLL